MFGKEKVIFFEPLFGECTPEQAFEKVFSLKGDVYREQKGRKTIRFEHDGKYCFAKIHLGVGWKEIFKNLLQLKLPVISARNEWLAIQKFKRIGIPTTPLVAYGRRGINPSKVQSFVITREIEDITNLEEYCKNWEKVSLPSSRKRELITRIATMIKRLHDSGMNHRDLYLCHFLLTNNKHESGEILYLIDLHRVQIRPKVPERWKVKDLGGLFFSAMDLDLTKTDLFRFIKAYEDKDLREIMKNKQAFWKRVERRAKSLYEKHSRRPKL